MNEKPSELDDADVVFNRILESSRVRYLAGVAEHSGLPVLNSARTARIVDWVEERADVASRE